MEPLRQDPSGFQGSLNLAGDGEHPIDFVQLIAPHFGRVDFLPNVRHDRNSDSSERTQGLRNPPDVIHMQYEGAFRHNNFSQRTHRRRAFWIRQEFSPGRQCYSVMFDLPTVQFLNEEPLRGAGDQRLVSQARKLAQNPQQFALGASDFGHPMDK